MFKVIVLLAIFATIYGVPTPPPSPSSVTAETISNAQPHIVHPAAALPALQREIQSDDSKPTVVPLSKTETKSTAAVVKAINGEEDPKNEKEELEGAEFGWGLRRWGWGYPGYTTYYSYPTYYPSYGYRYWW